MDAAAAGDERLAAAAKRALEAKRVLECELLERAIRQRFGPEAFEMISSDVKMCVGELLG